MAQASLRDEILAPLHRLHAAQEAHDVDEMLNAYATDGFVNVQDMRRFFESLIEQDAFRTRTVDWSECESFVHGDYALIKPVKYDTPNGTRYFSYHLSKKDDGKWLIIDNSRSQSRQAQSFTQELVADAGRTVGFRGMLWTRRLDAPVDKVWELVSTKEGLDKWFLTRSVEIDLRPGGLFKHHWTNTVRDFKTNEFIDFAGVPDDEAEPNNLMRFQLLPDGDGTVFSFLDSFNGADKPLSLPWTMSGWHGGINSLETAITGKEIKHDFGLGGEFYWRYLRNFHKLADMTSKLNAPDGATADEWRKAYLTESL